MDQIKGISDVRKFSTFSEKRTNLNKHNQQYKEDSLRERKFSSYGNHNLVLTENIECDIPENGGEFTQFLQTSKKKAKSKKLEKQNTLLKTYLMGLKKKLSSTIKEDKLEDEVISCKTFNMCDENSKLFLNPVISRNTTIKSNKVIVDNFPQENIMTNNFVGSNENIVDQVFTVTSSDRDKESVPLILVDNKNKISSGLSFRQKFPEEKNKGDIEKYTFRMETKPSNTQMENKNLITFPKIQQKKENDFNNSREYHKFDKVYDSITDEEEENTYIDATNNCLIHPESRFKIIWDGVCSLMILYSIILTPYRLAFQLDNESTNNSYFYIDLLIDSIFLIDLIINFFTPYYRNEVLVTNSKMIVIRYLKTWFIIDLLASLPLNAIFLIVQMITEGSSNLNTLKSLNKISRFIRFYRLLKWIRIFRVLKLSSKGTSHFWKHITSFLENNFFKFLISFIILVYITSCLWCFLGKVDETHTIFDENWITRYHFENKDDGTIFVISIYFVCTTIFTIGYGDITASNVVERVFLVFLMTIGSLIWSFVLTSLSYVFSHKQEKQVTYEKKLEILDKLNLEYQLDEKTIVRLKKYLYYEFQRYNKDQVSLMETLPGNLKNKLYLNMYEKHISNLQFFKDQSYDFIVAVLPLLKYVNYLKGEHIISIGNIVESVYMLHQGTLGIFLGPYHENYEIAKIVSSYHIGDILMYADDQSQYDVKVKSRRAELLVLSKSDFANLKLAFKDAIKKILKKSHEIYKEIEKKKEAVLNFFNLHKTIKGFKYQPLPTFNTHIFNNVSPHNSNKFNNIIPEEDEEYEEDFVIKDDKNFQKKFETNYKNLVSVVNSYSKLSKQSEKLKKELSFIENDEKELTEVKEKSIQESKSLGHILIDKLPGSVGNFSSGLDKFVLVNNKDITELYTPTNVETAGKEETGKSESSCSSGSVGFRDEYMKMSQNFKSADNVGTPNSKTSSIFIINNLNIGSQSFFGGNKEKSEGGIPFNREINRKRPSNKPYSRHNKSQNFSSYINRYTNKMLGENSMTQNNKNYKPRTPHTPVPLRQRDWLLKEKSTKYLKKDMFKTTFTEKDKFKCRKSVLFLNSINDKIENDAIMFKNKEIMSEYLRDVLKQEKREDSKFKNVCNRLDKLENKLKGFLGSKNFRK